MNMLRSSPMSDIFMSDVPNLTGKSDRTARLRYSEETLTLYALSSLCNFTIISAHVLLLSEQGWSLF